MAKSGGRVVGHPKKFNLNNEAGGRGRRQEAEAGGRGRRQEAEAGGRGRGRRQRQESNSKYRSQAKCKSTRGGFPAK